MAKKSQATKKSSEQAISVSRIRINQLFFESLLIVQGFLGIFVFLALFSYSSLDPTWNSKTFSNPMVVEELMVSNIVGYWGAYLSDFLLSFAGYMAYLVVYWLIWPSFRHFFLYKRPVQFSQIYSGFLAIKIAGWTMVLISGSTLVTLFLEPGNSYLPYEAGGIIGSSVSSYTFSALSFIGSSLLFICLGLLGLTLSFEISWSSLIIKLQTYLLNFGGGFGERASGYLTKVREKLRLRKEKIERQKKIVEEVSKREKQKPPEVIKEDQEVKVSKRVEKEKQEELFEYKEVTRPPKLSLLDSEKEEYSDETSEQSLRQLGDLVVNKLAEYGIHDVSVESIQPGPVVIRLELRLRIGLTVSYTHLTLQTKA